MGTGTEGDPGRVLLKVDDPVRFSIGGGRLVVEHRGRGVSRELPLTALSLLARFATWTPLSRAFGDPHEDRPTVLTWVRDLLSAGILVAQNDDADRGTTRRDRWDVWGTALPYHLESRITADAPFLRPAEAVSLLTERATLHPCPPVFKDYPATQFYPLPDPEPPTGHRQFLEVLLARRTCRSFSGESISVSQLSCLLFFTWGCTGVWMTSLADTRLLLKTSPSGGSRHSIEVYPILLNVEGLPHGVYHYSVRRHGLEILSAGDPREWLVAGCGDKRWVNDCAAAFVMTAVVDRVMWKYTEPRAYRVLLFDVGHLSQTFALVATLLRLGSYATAAVRDEVFERRLGLDYLAEPVLLVNGAGVRAALA